MMMLQRHMPRWAVGEILFVFASWDLDGDIMGSDGVGRFIFL
jgi:hypothetical protein